MAAGSLRTAQWPPPRTPSAWSRRWGRPGGVTSQSRRLSHPPEVMRLVSDGPGAREGQPDPQPGLTTELCCQGWTSPGQGAHSHDFTGPSGVKGGPGLQAAPSFLRRPPTGRPTPSSDFPAVRRQRAVESILHSLFKIFLKIVVKVT